jgi:hypothetical protein
MALASLDIRLAGIFAELQGRNGQFNGAAIALRLEGEFWAIYAGTGGPRWQRGDFHWWKF